MAGIIVSFESDKSRKLAATATSAAFAIPTRTDSQGYNVVSVSNSGTEMLFIRFGSSGLTAVAPESAGPTLGDFPVRGGETVYLSPKGTHYAFVCEATKSTTGWITFGWNSAQD